MGAVDHLSPQEFPRANLHPDRAKPLWATRPETQKAVMTYIREGGAEDFDLHAEKFDYVERQEPMDEVKQQVMANPELSEIADTFGEYHQWYVSRGSVPQHADRWPAIRSSVPDDPFGYFEDGWHRFHSYVAQGDDTVPTVEMRRRQGEF